MQITLVGWSDDTVNIRYLCALQALVETMRHEEKKGSVTARLDQAADAITMSELLCRPTDVMIYGGHAGIKNKRPFLGSGPSRLHLDQIRPIRGKGIETQALVLDSCHGGDDEFQKALIACLDSPKTVVLSCDARSQYAHGPPLLPILLAQLASPDPPPQLTPTKIRSMMKKTTDAAKSIRTAKWERWIITPKL